MTARAQELPLRVRFARRMSGWWSILILATLVVAFVIAALKLYHEAMSSTAPGGESDTVSGQTVPRTGYDLGNGVVCHQCR